MHVQKGDAITFHKRLTRDIKQLTANFFEATDRDMARNQRIRHAREPPLLQINICAADLA